MNAPAQREGPWARQALAGAAALLVGLAFGMAIAQTRLPTDHLTVVTGTGRHLFTVEVARTREQRMRGLMFRESLRGNAGMLFDFRVDRPVGMWMKNTLISLDMLFIDRTGAIVKVAHSASPGDLRLIESERPVRAVLEIPGGRAAHLGVAVGDRVEHPMFGRAAEPRPTTAE